MSLETIVIGLSLIFGGCCANVMTLEAVVKRAPDSGALVTFLQFLVTALTQIPSQMTIESNFAKHDHLILLMNFPGSKSLYWKKPKVSVSLYLRSVVFFFGTSVLNNRALSYGVAMPLHIVFRSSSLAVGMIMAHLFMGRRYSVSQIIAVILVTVGVMTTTWASAGDAPPSGEAPPLLTWLIGVGHLMGAVILSCWLGIEQERHLRVFKADHRESLFYTHALGLPLFIVFYDSIIKSALYCQQGSDSWQTLNILNQSPFVPVLWSLVFLNAATQYLCVSGVHRLATAVTNLTLNMALNARKLVSLLLSVVIYGNRFEMQHIVGSSLVVAGTILYSKSSSPPDRKPVKEKEEPPEEDSEETRKYGLRARPPRGQ